MKLVDWMEWKKITQVDLAEKLGVNQGFISMVLAGKKNFSDELAAKVEEITGGEVTFVELKHPKFRQACNE